MIRKVALLTLLLGSIAAVGVAQNDTPAHARTLIGDGTMFTDFINVAGSQHWWTAVVQGGHSYALEAWAPSEIAANNGIVMSVYEENGTTPFFSANTGSCASSTTASPSLDGNNPAGTDGTRCLFAVLADNAAPTRVMRIKIADSGSCASCYGRIRLRETTVLSRWSVNGYNMYVAIHNPDVASLAGAVLYYPDSPAGPAGFVASDAFLLGGFASTQFVRNSLSLNPNHGSIHIVTYGASLPYGSVDAHVQTYAYSTTAGTFNFFLPERLNHGGPNSQNFAP